MIHRADSKQNRFDIPAQMTVQIDGDLVFQNLATGCHFGFAPVGKRGWDRRVDGRPVAGVQEAMVPEFHAAPDNSGSELLDLVGKLTGSNLDVAVSRRAG